MIADYLQSDNLRYERKFRVETLSHYEIEALIKNHPVNFSEIYFKRAVNNIYFDSLTMQDYNDAVNGTSNRKKVRIRWYGDMLGNINNPVVEFKIKHSHLGTKVSYPLKHFKLDNELDLSSLNKAIMKSDLPNAVRSYLLDLRPSLTNRYERKYFISSNEKFRITVDTSMQYTSFSPQNNFYERNAVIIELKYDQSFDNEASNVSDFFPFRVTKNSKYTCGIECLAFA